MTDFLWHCMDPRHAEFWAWGLGATQMYLLKLWEVRRG